MKRRRKPLIDVRHGIEVFMRSVGAPERCETKEVDPCSNNCIVCNAIEGEACLSRLKKTPGRYG